MAESVYTVVELIGTSDKSWEDAAKAAVERAAKSLRDLRVAEVVQQDIVIENGKEAYRTKLKVSFKYAGAAAGLSASKASLATGAEAVAAIFAFFFNGSPREGGGRELSDPR